MQLFDCSTLFEITEHRSRKDSKCETDSVTSQCNTALASSENFLGVEGWESGDGICTTAITVWNAITTTTPMMHAMQMYCKNAIPRYSNDPPGGKQIQATKSVYETQRETTLDSKLKTTMNRIYLWFAPTCHLFSNPKLFLTRLFSILFIIH